MGVHSLQSHPKVHSQELGISRSALRLRQLSEALPWLTSLSKHLPLKCVATLGPIDPPGLPPKKEPSLSSLWISQSLFFLLGQIPAANYPIYIVLKLLTGLCHKNARFSGGFPLLPHPRAQPGIFTCLRGLQALLPGPLTSRGLHLCLVAVL